jgi:membrane peptidoglycan carboxypeptidase
MYVKEYLNEKYGEEFVEQGGLRVITTLNWELQQEAERVVQEGAARNEELVQAANAALVSVDPRNGEVLAMVGSKDFWGESIPEGCTSGVDCRFDPFVNVSLRNRQPGSAFKPFIYATAFKKGYTPETVLFDIPTEFNPYCNPDGTPGPRVRDEKDCYHPQNYDDTYKGPVTLRQALAQSLNVPSVKLLYLAGVRDSMDTAEALGISTLGDESQYGLSLVLGGAEVTLLEMASAFGVFAQEGILHPPTAILRVEDPNGFALEEKRETALPVLDTEIARTINDILSDNNARIPTFSPRSSLYFPDRQVAAKTGTTQDYRDAWVVGYTPSLVTGVWVGNNDNSAMNQSGLSIMVAGPIWHKLFEYYFSRTPPEAFTPPTPTESDKPVFRGLYRSGPIVKIDTISGKLATAYTPLDLIEELSFGDASSILSFIKRDDPTGAPPADPNSDLQFKNWEFSLRAWLEKNPLAILTPPEEYDDIHSPEKQPEVILTNLNSEAVVVENIATVNVMIKTYYPLREVSLFINDTLISSRTTPIFSTTFSFPLDEKLIPGDHTIKITVYDAVGNKAALEKHITVLK